MKTLSFGDTPKVIDGGGPTRCLLHVQATPVYGGEGADATLTPDSRSTREAVQDSRRIQRIVNSETSGAACTRSGKSTLPRPRETNSFIPSTSCRPDGQRQDFACSAAG